MKEVNFRRANQSSPGLRTLCFTLGLENKVELGQLILLTLATYLVNKHNKILIVAQISQDTHPAEKNLAVYIWVSTNNNTTKTNFPNQNYPLQPTKHNQLLIE